MHTVMNLNYGWEIFMFPPPKCDAPYTNYTFRSYTKYKVLSLVRFPSQACESSRNNTRLSAHLRYQTYGFQHCLCMEFSEGKHSAPSLKDTMDEDDFAGFNVCNKDTFH